MSTIVLKFGGSYLRGHADLLRAVHAIYARLRQGERVVCVTSAFHGRTDELERSLDALHPGCDARVRAALLATGEAETAALLVAALDRAGIPAVGADVRRYGPFVAPGTEQPTGVDAAGLESLLNEAAVVVIPGFAAVEDTEERAPALLGRGGSDMTAVVLGRALACRTVLVKDVEGLYTSDPSSAAAGPPPRRLARVSFGDALGLGPDILQPRAVELAQAAGLEFEVVGPGHVTGTRGTKVGVAATHISTKGEAPAPLRVALLGLGTVGARVFAELSSAPDQFDVVSVLVRAPSKGGRPPAAEPLITADFDEALAAGAELVVEATGGAEPAASWMRRAMSSGVHVVTANKVAAALTVDPTLEQWAQRAGVHFRSSAAVGGALPALETVARLAHGSDRLVGIEGVLNGTCNAVLGEIARGKSLDEALQCAQGAGLAEADPTADIDGTDTAHKIELLARAAGWPAPRWLRQDGIERRADFSGLRGGRTRLVGSVHLSDVGPVARVAPRVVGPGHPFFDLMGEWNALRLSFASGETLDLRGRGAGAWPTATAVLGDVHWIARRLQQSGRRQARTAAPRREQD